VPSHTKNETLSYKKIKGKRKTRMTNSNTLKKKSNNRPGSVIITTSAYHVFCFSCNWLAWYDYRMLDCVGPCKIDISE